MGQLTEIASKARASCIAAPVETGRGDAGGGPIFGVGQVVDVEWNSVDGGQSWLTVVYPSDGSTDLIKHEARGCSALQLRHTGQRQLSTPSLPRLPAAFKEDGPVSGIPAVTITSNPS